MVARQDFVVSGSKQAVSVVRQSPLIQPIQSIPLKQLIPVIQGIRRHSSPFRAVYVEILSLLNLLAALEGRISVHFQKTICLLAKKKCTVLIGNQSDTKISHRYSVRTRKLFSVVSRADLEHILRPSYSEKSDK